MARTILLIVIVAGIGLFLLLLAVSVMRTMNNKKPDKPTKLTNPERNELRIYRAFYNQVARQAVSHAVLPGETLPDIILDEVQKTREQIDRVNN